MNNSTIQNDTITFPGKIMITEQLGGETIYHVETAIGMFKVKTKSDWNKIDDQVNLYFPFNKLMFFDKAGNRVLMKRNKWSGF